jgi:toxin YhaV
MVAVNGWELFAHPLFLDQLETLTAAVERARVKDAHDYRRTANAKLLAALRQLVFETIPQDPSRPDYRQGGTLGDDRKHWFRAKFGSGRFRLFFRYSTHAKIIIFAWVNDETTLRTYGAKSDAYAVFRKMLDKGDPPDDWAALLAGGQPGRSAAAHGRGCRARLAVSTYPQSLPQRWRAVRRMRSATAAKGHVAQEHAADHHQGVG